MNDEVEAFKGETSGRGRGACRAPIAEDDRMTTGWMHGSPRLPLLQPKYRHKHTQKGMDGSSSSSLIFLESKAALVGGFGAGAFRAPLIIRSPLMNWQLEEQSASATETAETTHPCAEEQCAADHVTQQPPIDALLLPPSATGACSHNHFSFRRSLLLTRTRSLSVTAGVRRPRPEWQKAAAALAQTREEAKRRHLDDNDRIARRPPPIYFYYLHRHGSPPIDRTPCNSLVVAHTTSFPTTLTFLASANTHLPL
ncbi:hypothetical protein LSTR_LSTR012928 [Laodelphax striatellus]|uniref:Uncharacterized protein n=1 Tax=Laodelphax striatellus TaxID=195883 RepID=A0A482X715_LAOST|nr:hypothetical protein LSTR_LSTR012928 [Laodelphax striatellus]